MTNKGRLRHHHRANPWLITVLLVCNKNLLWMNQMWVLVLLLLLRLRRCGALPPCSRLDWRSCWLNNSLLRPPNSGRHRCRLLGRGYPDVKVAISPRPLSSRRSTRRRRRTKRANDGLALLMRWVECSRNVELIQMSGTRYIGIDWIYMCFLDNAGHTERYVGTGKNSLNLSTGLLTRW